MTCKDCLHGDMCEGYIPTDLDRDVWHYCREGKTDQIPDIEERCSSFKDSQNYVEVPCRCKECKYWKHYDHLGCTDFAKVCTLAYYMIGENGYCLYGERKDNG